MTDRMAHEESDQERPVGIVLSGAGARGAYEAGVLSVLLPLLKGPDRPRIIVGTSAGALNAAMMASAIAQLADPGKALTTNGWEKIKPEKVFAAPWLSLLRLAERRLRRPVGVFSGLLDTDVLRETLASMLPTPTIRVRSKGRGIGRGRHRGELVRSAGAVVFFESGQNPQSKPGIEYIQTDLGLDHLMASSAFPLAFPARWVGGRGQGWYIDGGVHLNTPIKPAIDFGAGRILVIGATPWDISQPPERSNPPNMVDGSSQLLHAMLVDSMRADLQTLMGVNRELLARPTGSGSSPSGSTHRVVEFCVAKPHDDVLSKIADQTWPSGALPFIRSLCGYPVLGPLTPQRQRPGEFLSSLCFDEGFISKAIAYGQCDHAATHQTSEHNPLASVRTDPHKSPAPEPAVTQLEWGRLCVGSVGY